jgi:hypothetical protein
VDIGGEEGEKTVTVPGIAGIAIELIARLTAKKGPPAEKE